MSTVKDFRAGDRVVVVPLKGEEGGWAEGLTGTVRYPHPDLPHWTTVDLDDGRVLAAKPGELSALSSGGEEGDRG